MKDHERLVNTRIDGTAVGERITRPLSIDSCDRHDGRFQEAYVRMACS